MTQTQQEKTLGRSQPGRSIAPMQKHLGNNGTEKQLHLDGRKRGNTALGREQRR